MGLSVDLMTCSCLVMDEKGRCVATTVRILGKRVPKKEHGFLNSLSKMPAAMS